jgi:hypothetical protein
MDDPWAPYANHGSFILADLLFRREQMPAKNINDLMQVWAALSHQDPPFADAEDLYNTIDMTPVGDIPWQSFSISFVGEIQADVDKEAPWKLREYEVWFRDPLNVLKLQLGNPDFANEMDVAPKIVRDASSGLRRYQDFMSGEWAWREAVSTLDCNMISLFSDQNIEQKLG